MKIGVIADDFTGASDAASFLAKGGMDTTMFNGIPSDASFHDREIHFTDAVVIGLKTRTAPVNEAVSDSLKACRWLTEHGAEHIYIKYCSTFDSTPKGNIGPICDSIMEELGVPYSILCPALPVNGRTVKNGQLFVKGVPLDKSPMKNHPLTPMWDSRIAVLMAEQSRYPVYPLTIAEVKKGSKYISQQAKFCCTGKKNESPDTADGISRDHLYFVPDFYADGQDADIAEAFGDCRLLTGGSGILEALAKKYLPRNARHTNIGSVEEPEGNALILAGSCSKATLQQIQTFQKNGEPYFRIYPDRLFSGSQTVAEMEEFIQSHKDEDVLLYSSAPSDEVRRIQEDLGNIDRVSGMLERTMAEIAEWGAANGRTRLIVAGGETSGAVIKGLSLNSFYIGKCVAPGVPVIIPCHQTKMRIVLKSGNFGDENFFMEAIEKTKR